MPLCGAYGLLVAARVNYWVGQWVEFVLHLEAGYVPAL